MSNSINRIFVNILKLIPLIPVVDKYSQTPFHSRVVVVTPHPVCIQIGLYSITGRWIREMETEAGGGECQ